jgi:hypothetical protein
MCVHHPHRMRAADSVTVQCSAVCKRRLQLQRRRLPTGERIVNTRGLFYWHARAERRSKHAPARQPQPSSRGMTKGAARRMAFIPGGSDGPVELYDLPVLQILGCGAGGHHSGGYGTPAPGLPGARESHRRPSPGPRSGGIARSRRGSSGGRLRHRLSGPSETRAAYG